MRRSVARCLGVSAWSWKDSNQFVDFVHDPMMLGAAPQGHFLADITKTPFLRSERVFVDCDICIENPTKAKPLYHASCEVQKHVNCVLTQELLATFGLAKMTGISIDPTTNKLLHPPTLPCSIDEWGEMTAIHENYNSDVKKAVLRTVTCVGNAFNESLKTKAKITATKESTRESITEGNVDTLTIKWLQMSGFDLDGDKRAFELKGHEKRHFPYRGVHGVAAIPDAIVVQAKSGDLVLIVEDKAGFWHSNQGDLAQIFGEALCALYHNYFTNEDHSRTPSSKLYAIRMYNHHASFFILEATKEQVDDVCLKRKLQRSFKKMTLTSDTPDPGCLSRRKITSRPVEEYLGWNLVDKATRFEAQWRMAKLRQILEK